ncbi:MAG: hypothetical protein LAT67_00265 [Balneolales bacterium]|nr:hypothetical protein [Balneolales bacterium]
MDFIYQLSYNWFVVFYASLGIIFFLNGIIWYRNPQPFTNYLGQCAESGEKPGMVLKFIKYLFLFSATSLILSFFPFRLIDFFFTVWCLAMIFIIGSMLLRWESLKAIILKNPLLVAAQIKRGGLMMLSISFVLFLLTWYKLSSGSI